MQSEDPDLHPIYQRLLQGQSRPTKPEVAGTSWETRCLWALRPKLVMQENMLYFQDGPAYLRRIVVPISTVTTVLCRLHEEVGHSGQNKTKEARTGPLSMRRRAKPLTSWCRVGNFDWHQIRSSQLTTMSPY
ncbi:hypothetical protein EG68_01121 [Paragonimus skrjabini miyazakii]|uniref:Uncharacterized protein n=1 Tax=Paragonimus skrjabini miyazakii TaxID=59628 RepID=A0A8S9Z644_9TREM|nr:hypothetical protein EG68_01121 [Paragonimus skrjabini miyazakii]